MNLNDYIECLTKLRDEHGGDIRVVETVAYAPAYAIRDTREPIVDTLQIKRNRESYEKVFRKSISGVKSEDSGVKVIVI